METGHGSNDDSKRSETNAASLSDPPAEETTTAVKQLRLTATTTDATTPPPLAVTMPIDVIPEILARLPVKPLLQFRTVCKSWDALISDPKFAKKQHLLAPSAYPSRVHLISFEDDGFKDYPLPSLLAGTRSSVAAPTQRRFPCGKESYCEVVCGSCHGMLCFANEEEGLALVLNPSTGKFRTLPHIDFRGGLECTPSFGFGYDHLSDSYKVVVVSRYETDDGYGEVDVKVHTLGDDSWRGIEVFPDDFEPARIELNVPGRFASGTINWLFVDYEDDENTSVASLDLGTETFQELFLPPIGEDYDEIYELNLAVLRGCLGLLVDGDDRSDFWLMKDYGNLESWTKVFSTPFPYEEHSPHPLSIRGEDDEILLEDKSALVVHDSKSLTSITCSTVDFRGFDKFNGGCVSYAYSESLISP